MKIIFAGTPDFAVSALSAIAEKHQILGVFTQPDRKSGRGKKLTPSPVKQFATDHGLEVFQPSSLKGQASLIRSFDADVMVVVAYGMLLPQDILNAPRLGCINIHASLLPRWRGAAPIQRAIEAGDAETGVSIMQMEAGLDTGPVFKMLKTDIGQQDTSATLHQKLAAIGANGICEVLAELEFNPSFKPVEQDHTNSNYAKKIIKQEAELDWQKPAQSLHQQLRAFIPWPVAQTHHGATRLRILQASVLEQKHNSPAGTIVDTSDQGLHIACGMDILRIEVIQRDGSRPLAYKEFKNGYSLDVGQRLGKY